MELPFRFSVCNEIFKDAAFADGCRQSKHLGYAGIEIAPFTLAEFPAKISLSERMAYRHIMKEEGLSFVGLHWLLVSPPGLHVTTPDKSLRAKSWQHIRDLIDLCADLGESGVMVFGSPKQRNAVNDIAVSEAVKNFTAELAQVAPLAQERGVRILVEALPSDQSNVINTLREAVSIVEQIGSPAVQTMFDTHNAADETESHTELVRRYFSHIAHIHVNEMDGREPGTGNYNFATLMQTLAELQYRDWVSLEVFDFTRGADVIAGGALNHLRQQLQSAASSPSELISS